MILVGRLLDRYGTRILLCAVVVLFSIVVACMSLINHPVHLYLGFAGIRTLGQGSLTLIPTTLVAIWFIRLRGRATALTTLGMGASTAAFPPLIHWLVSDYGWRDAWIVLSITVCALLLVPALLLVRRSPESVGLLPDGASRPGSVFTGTADPSRPPEISWQLNEAVRTRAFWLLLAAMSSPSIVSTALHVPPHLPHGQPRHRRRHRRRRPQRRRPLRPCWLPHRRIPRRHHPQPLHPSRQPALPRRRPHPRPHRQPTSGKPSSTAQSLAPAAVPA